MSDFTIYLSMLDTPIGAMKAGVTDDAVVFLEFDRGNRVDRQFESIRLNKEVETINERRPMHDELANQLAAYFEGSLTEFNIPIKTLGTPFQAKVWDELRMIPYGETRSYQQISEKLGDPNALRAVAGANSSNHIAIIIPCHRVIGKDGSLVGYAAGIERKRWLLNHEREITGPPESVPGEQISLM